MNFKTGNLLRGLAPDNEREIESESAREGGNNRARDQHGS